MAGALLSRLLPFGRGARSARLKRGADALRVAGRLEEAVLGYREALRVDPRNADAGNNLGVTLDALGRRPEAIAAYRAALAADPSLAETHVNLGNALQMQGDAEAAIHSYLEAARVRPGYALTYRNLAVLYRDLGRHDEARECEARVLEIEPSDAARIRQAIALPAVVQSLEHIDRIRGELRAQVSAFIARGVRLEDPLVEIGQANFYLAYHGRNDLELQQLMARLYATACPSLSWTAPHCAAAPARERRRVGFLSRNFFGHSVGAWYSGLIDRLAAAGALEVSVITAGAADEAALRSTFPSVRSHVALPYDLAAARARVAELELDVLVYPDIGMDPLGYFLAFSRLAPVQCAMFGHPVTSGIPSVDYFISSALFEPPGAQAHYSERLLALDALPAYLTRPALPARPKTRRELGLPGDRRLYVCPTMLHKLHPDFDPALGDILRRDPQGEVVLFQDSRQRHWHSMVLERLQRTLPDVVGRVRFLPWLSGEDLMSVLLLADVVLDTFHFGAATTTMLVLAAGTPIVTLPGEFARGRATLGCYTRIGVLDCVAGSPGEYVELALGIAADSRRRQALRERILARSAELYEDPRLLAAMQRTLATLQPLSRP